MPDQQKPFQRSWSVDLRPSRSWRQAARRPWLLGLLILLGTTAVLWLGRHQLAAKAPWLTSRFQPPPTYSGFDYWAVGSPGESDRNDLCGVPGWPNERWYARVTAADLPWTGQDGAEDPAPLAQLQENHDAQKLVAAFRITLPDPQFEEAHNVGLAARRLAGQVVEPGEVFSTNGQVGPYTAEQGFGPGPSYAGNRLVQTEGGGVCKIASALYNTAVFSGLEIVERHPHSMLVPYAPPGRDATVAVGYKDLRFRNSAPEPVVIWAQLEGLDLFVAFYSNFDPPAVQWDHEVLSEQETWTIRQPKNTLPAGKEKVVHPGYPGLTVQTWLEVTAPDGSVERRDLGIDTYQPMPKLVEYGP